jgi:hypothetical protein
VKYTTSSRANVHRKQFDSSFSLDRAMRWWYTPVAQQFAASSKRVQCGEPSRTKPSVSPAKRPVADQPRPHVLHGKAGNVETRQFSRAQ